MSSTLIRVASAALVLLPALASAADLDVRTGEWDFTQTMIMSGAPIYIEAFTPAQRAAYAKDWAKDAGKPIVQNDKQCIRPKDLKDATLFKEKTQEGKDCKQLSVKATSRSWTAVIECKDEKTTTKTNAEYTAPSPDRLNGVLKSTTTSPNGTTVFDFKFSGKWVGSTCSEEESSEESEPAADEESDK